MTVAQSRVLLCGRNSSFFEFAAFHLAASGIQTVPVGGHAGLLEAALAEAPDAVLLHWDTLGDDSLRLCARVKALLGSHVPVLVVSERLGGGIDIVAAFTAGADGLIEGAHNPRILLMRLRHHLGSCAAAEAVPSATKKLAGARP